MPKRSGQSARVRRAARNTRRTARSISYSDIPEASPRQLKAMQREDVSRRVRNRLSDGEMTKKDFRIGSV
jgi:hypothetical protein